MNAKIDLVTVAICTCNRQGLLQGALESLIRLRTGPDIRYRIVVVDDGSQDATPEVIRRVIEASPVEIQSIRHEQNRGIPAARNACIRQAQGRWIAFFDDDQVADPGWLAHLVAVARSTGADCVGGPYLVQSPGPPLPASLRRMLGENPIMLRPLAKRFGMDPRRRQSAMAAAMGTGNVLLRRTLFDEIGRFSETRQRGEDIEFFLRAWKHGATFAIAPEAIIHHMIPSERLSPGYLLRAAGQGGAVNAQIDVEAAGVRRALWNASLRGAHLALWTAPALAAAWFARDPHRTLAKRCSARFAVHYLAMVLGALGRDASSC